MSRTSSEVAVSATTASIRPVTSASAPSSTNGASVDVVIEPTRRMARAGSRVAGRLLTYHSGSEAASTVAGTRPVAVTVASCQVARASRSSSTPSSNDPCRLMSVAGGTSPKRPDADASEMSARISGARGRPETRTWRSMAPDASKVSGVATRTSGMRSATAPVSETCNASLAAVPAASRPLATSVVSPTRNSRSSATTASLE